MDRDTDLFVQAFWVKCRDIIRPELDRAVDELKGAGHDANVSTQEYSPVADQLPDIGPVLTLTVHPKGAPEGRTLQFHGDVAKGNLEIIGNGGKAAHRYELASLDEAVTKREIADWLAVALNHHP
jgi:hypothetical protein